jgi:N-acetyl-anhydromuramyl-L-alanine amidase AmpD
MLKKCCLLLLSFSLFFTAQCQNTNKCCQNGKYKEIERRTPNFSKDKTNTVEGVILHHTAEPTAEKSLAILTGTERKVGAHVVIDTDGTRFILCKPTVVTWHAGYSILNGREGCNNFTIGIEFQGNTLEMPLTEDQIDSAIEYLLPLIKKYNIPIKNIVTHETIRNAYMKKYPNKRVSGKVDITPTEYKRFMAKLNAALAEQKSSSTEVK